MSGFHFFRCADSLREGAGYEFQGLLILVSFYDLLDEVKNLNVSSLGTFIKYYKISQLIHTQSIAN